MHLVSGNTPVVHVASTGTRASLKATVSSRATTVREIGEVWRSSVTSASGQSLPQGEADFRLMAICATKGNDKVIGENAIADFPFAQRATIVGSAVTRTQSNGRTEAGNACR